MLLIFFLNQGYITILSDTERFLRLKNDIQQISEQRIRDLIFLFLCDVDLDVKAFLAIDELNCTSLINYKVRLI